MASHTGNPVVSIHMLPMTSRLINRTESRQSQLGSKYENARERKVVASLPLFHRNWPRVLSNVNDNYCVKFVTGLKDFACVPGKECLNPSPVMAGSRDLTSKSETVNLPVNSCIANVHFVTWLPQNKRRKSQLLSQLHRNKICERCFPCRSLELCKSCHICPNCCHRSTCRGKTAPVFMDKWEALGSCPMVVTALREGYTVPFQFKPNLTRSPTVISNYVNPQKHLHLLKAL